MSHGATRRSTRDAVAEQLRQLVGLPLSASRRAADLRTLQFGTLRPVERGSVGDFALHIQCPWRLEGPEGIVTGRLDLWEPVECGPEFNAEAWDYEKCGNLQDSQFANVMAKHGSGLIVSEVSADDCGGGSIAFSNGFVLRLFPAGTRGEDWRLFRPGTDAPHFVIEEGAVEANDDPTV